MSSEKGTPPHPGDTPSGELFHVLEMGVFRKRYPPAVLRPRAEQTERVGQELRERLGPRSVLGVAFYPWHDQTTLWWFEQGLLTLLAATGWDTVWVTDARYLFDEDRMKELPGRVSVLRQRATSDWQPPEGTFDTVVALFPSDHATRAARQLGARLVTFAIKNLHEDEAPLTEPPPPETRLWHAFAGSQNFLNAAVGKLGATAPAWRLVSAPFPTNRYYFPLRAARPTFDALLFGSKSRDYDTAFAALARAGAGRVATITDSDHLDIVAEAARRHGVDAEVNESMSHVRLLELLERSRLVLNPIMPPAESHYSLSVPLAVGRPIVATDRPAVRPFAGPGVLLAPAGDVDAWAAAITRFLGETAAGLPHRAALKQGQLQHDVDRFFASGLLGSLTA